MESSYHLDRAKKDINRLKSRVEALEVETIDLKHELDIAYSLLKVHRRVLRKIVGGADPGSINLQEEYDYDSEYDHTNHRAVLNFCTVSALLFNSSTILKYCVYLPFKHLEAKNIHINILRALSPLTKQSGFDPNPPQPDPFKTPQPAVRFKLKSESPDPLAPRDAVSFDW
ncbi:uncharacterized protein MELLADRAFT_59309 [Melampsora larici-populina 98AG31]|uniref:Uncharacterized protein n=1 Tax=Melampsora larici-populina (strain 98AG31 / pathotype 3-4-7) TaxID=747676 RepID=F4R5U4_MELLP|nr:uncharacterized protein MELLADRAFT_59309 [Melampsora larici-populina 98AG31]EGG12193.1 hypothetical protein MELLADRAFT_59309 [Melampsora larici-populina 98AG31]